MVQIHITVGTKETHILPFLDTLITYNAYMTRFIANTSSRTTTGLYILKFCLTARGNYTSLYNYIVIQLIKSKISFSVHKNVYRSFRLISHEPILF